MINNEKLKELCIDGEMTNGQLAKHFGVDVTEIYAWRSRNGLTIAKCKAIRDGTTERTEESIKVEIGKVKKALADARRKCRRAEDRLAELERELKEMTS